VVVVVVVGLVAGAGWGAFGGGETIGLGRGLASLARGEAETRGETSTGATAPRAEEPHEAHVGEQPHPITPEREKIQRGNQLVGALNDAMDRHDVKEMRRLVEIYREHEPPDENKLQEGYARIADCLQEPSEEARARAQAYYDTERASTLRRYVRRACLER